MYLGVLGVKARHRIKPTMTRSGQKFLAWDGDYWTPWKILDEKVWSTRPKRPINARSLIEIHWRSPLVPTLLVSSMIILTIDYYFADLFNRCTYLLFQFDFKMWTKIEMSAITMKRCSTAFRAFGPAWPFRHKTDPITYAWAKLCTDLLKRFCTFPSSVVMWGVNTWRYVLKATNM